MTSQASTPPGLLQSECEEALQEMLGLLPKDNFLLCHKAMNTMGAVLFTERLMSLAHVPYEELSRRFGDTEGQEQEEAATPTPAQPEVITPHPRPRRRPQNGSLRLVLYFQKYCSENTGCAVSWKNFNSFVGHFSKCFDKYITSLGNNTHGVRQCCGADFLHTEELAHHVWEHHMHFVPDDQTLHATLDSNPSPRHDTSYQVPMNPSVHTASSTITGQPSPYLAPPLGQYLTTTSSFKTSSAQQPGYPSITEDMPYRSSDIGTHQFTNTERIGDDGTDKGQTLDEICKKLDLARNSRLEWLDMVYGDANSRSMLSESGTPENAMQDLYFGSRRDEMGLRTMSGYPSAGQTMEPRSQTLNGLNMPCDAFFAPEPPYMQAIPDDNMGGAQAQNRQL